MAGTPLTDAINALTTYANTVTSASDTTLSDAVATLAAGYGGGGGGAFAKLDEITLTANSRTMQVNFDASWLSSYNIIIVILKGEQVSTDWIYFGVNASPNLSSNDYSKQQNPFVFPYIFTKSYDDSYVYLTWYGRYDSFYASAKSASFANNWSSLSNLQLEGYSKDIKAGATVTVYGANFNNL